MTHSSSALCNAQLRLETNSIFNNFARRQIAHCVHLGVYCVGDAHVFRDWITCHYPVQQIAGSATADVFTIGDALGKRWLG